MRLGAAGGLRLKAVPVTIRPASDDDAGAVSALLDEEGLESEFVAREFTVAEVGGRVIACARLKPVDGGHELASVAVDPAERGRGVGARVVRASLAGATGPVWGLAIAPGFFETLGFRRLDAVPPALKEKAEGACASSGFVPIGLAAPDVSRIAVRERYGDVARRAAEGGACCGESGRDYSEDELASLPATALLDLGTGNPVRDAALRPGETVVDLGSGPGGDVILAARAVGPEGRAIGVDFTPDMLALARRNAAAAGVANAEFVESPIERIALPDASADVVVSNCVVNLSTDKPAVLAQAHRILRPGGRLVVSDTLRDDEKPATDAPSCDCETGALTAAEWEAALLAAGFVDVRVEPEAPTGCCGGVGRVTARARKAGA